VRSKREGRRVRSALVGVLIVVVAACARPTSTAQQTPPAPSPSPTPTTPLALVATAPFHTGEVGVVYAPVALSATGGVQPYAWSVVAGALPAGLSIGSDGTVSGTPTSAGTFNFTIQAADSGDSKATIPGSVPIAAALSASLIPACATKCSVELGCVSVCGAFGAQSGGVGPYSYALTSGQLPAGTSLSGLTLTGTFVGLSGYLQFTVQVTDSFGAIASVAPTFWLIEHIALAGGTIGGSPTNPCYWTGCTRQFAYSGGFGTPTVQITGWNYTETCTGYPAPPKPCPAPSRPAVSAGGGLVTINVPSPGGTWINGYTATLTLVVTDQTSCGAGVNCSATANYTVVVYGG
jgi:hypothetical protein